MKKGVIIIVFISFAIFIINSPLLSQEGRGQGRLAGIVLDESGKPIEGASITLEYLEFSNKMSTTSNKKGQWGFIGLGRGTVVIHVEKEGFIPANVKLPVSGIKKNPDVKIVLKKVGSEISETGVRDESKDAVLKGNELFEQKKFAEALAIYQEVVRSEPKLFMVRLNIGNCLMEMQEYDKAIAEYQKLMEEMNSIPFEKRDKKLIAQVYAAIGDAYLRQDKFEEAQENFIKSIEIDPSDPALAYNVAEIMMNAGKTDDAIKYYEKASQIKPDWAKAYLKLGFAWLNKGDTKKATEFFKKVIEIASPDDPDVLVAKETIKTLSEIKK